MKATIKDFSNFTIDSETGEVVNTKTGKILKQSIANGYKQLCLSQDGRRKHFFIHQLIAMTFINENYDTNIHQIDHINHDKLDNSIENLRIVSSRNNHNNRINQSIHGVGVKKRYNGYEAYIQLKGKITYLGTFETAEEASQKYLNVKAQLEEVEKRSKNYDFTRRKRMIKDYVFEFYSI